LLTLPTLERGVELPVIHVLTRIVLMDGSIENIDPLVGWRIVELIPCRPEKDWLGRPIRPPRYVRFKGGGESLKDIADIRATPHLVGEVVRPVVNRGRGVIQFEEMGAKCTTRSEDLVAPHEIGLIHCVTTVNSVIKEGKEWRERG
jgi:hypothetical protein